MDGKISKLPLIVIIAVVASAAVLVLFGPKSNPQPRAQATSVPYNAFSYNCSQLESFVNQNISMNMRYAGLGGDTGWGLSAISNLQIMQLKACKP